MRASLGCRIGQGGRQLGIGAVIALPLLVVTGIGFAKFFPIAAALAVTTGVVVAGTIVSVVLAATYLPARRALRVPPRQALWGDWRSASLRETLAEGRPSGLTCERRDDPAHPRRTRMAWVVLCVAGLLEIAWAVGLKYTEGFTRLGPSVATAVAMIASMALLGIALRTLPLGTAYAIWTGIGSVGTAVLGIVLFREPATALRLACIALIVAGIVGLKITSGPPA